ncbi:MAG: ATP-binding cassette domain-containing protein [Thermodesulfobacteriota bacterium]
MLYDIRGLKKIYNGRTVLDLPELSFEKGKIYGLLGPNGSGKTTLLSILGFLTPPSAGDLFYKGRRVSFKEKSLLPLRKEVVVVDQHPILFSTTVYKNVEFGLKVRQVPKSRRPDIIEASLERVGMRDFMHARGGELSGGENQRVAIARALACSPQVMLFDEPTASVDVNHQIVIEEIIRDLHSQEGISILLSTHNLSQAAKLVHERIYLFEGRASAFTHENIYHGPVITQGGRRYCLVREKYPFPVNQVEDGPVKISVDPASIEIRKVEGATGKSESWFNGRIDQLTLERDRVRILVDVGIPLNILLNAEAYAKMNFSIGESVRIRCPKEAVAVI